MDVHYDIKLQRTLSRYLQFFNISAFFWNWMCFGRTLWKQFDPYCFTMQFIKDIFTALGFSLHSQNLRFFISLLICHALKTNLTKIMLEFTTICSNMLLKLELNYLFQLFFPVSGGGYLQEVRNYISTFESLFTQRVGSAFWSVNNRKKNLKVHTHTHTHRKDELRPSMRPTRGKGV